MLFSLRSAGSPNPHTPKGTRLNIMLPDSSSPWLLKIRRRQEETAIVERRKTASEHHPTEAGRGTIHDSQRHLQQKGEGVRSPGLSLSEFTGRTHTDRRSGKERLIPGRF